MERSGSMASVGRAAFPLWATLALIAAGSWALTVSQAGTMGAGPGTMGMAFLFFMGMWVAMMAAMMLPAIGPLAATETAVAHPGAGGFRIPRGIAFAAGFLIPWAAYGALAFLALLGTERLVEASPNTAKWLGVGIFAVAGLYQLSPWKLRALLHCRMPMSRGRRDGRMGDLEAGARDGAVCVGCCWAFMAILIAVGVMNVFAMVGLAVVIFAEKVLPRPRLIAVLAGAAFLVFAALAAVNPSLIPGLHEAGMTMNEMGGM